jgi:hypothetical protein
VRVFICSPTYRHVCAHVHTDSLLAFLFNRKVVFATNINEGNLTRHSTKRADLEVLRD